MLCTVFLVLLADEKYEIWWHIIKDLICQANPTLVTNKQTVTHFFYIDSSIMHNIMVPPATEFLKNNYAWNTRTFFVTQKWLKWLIAINFILHYDNTLKNVSNCYTNVLHKSIFESSVWTNLLALHWIKIITSKKTVTWSLENNFFPLFLTVKNASQKHQSKCILEASFNFL